MTRKSARHVSHPADATQPEEQAPPAASKVRNISLSQLVLSPTNVRKTPATAAEEAQLEASIRARGILQNLIVHQTPIDGRGVYEVVVGGRRLKILQKLAAEGVIDADYPVPCLVREPAASLETSLMENTIRAAMLGSALQMSSFCSQAVIAGLYKGPSISGGIGRRPGQAFPQQSEDNA
jgi:hypothetical protein